jgi:hypothetical protein
MGEVVKGQVNLGIKDGADVNFGSTGFIGTEYIKKSSPYLIPDNRGG